MVALPSSNLGVSSTNSTLPGPRYFPSTNPFRAGVPTERDFFTPSSSDQIISSVLSPTVVEIVSEYVDYLDANGRKTTTIERAKYCLNNFMKSSGINIPIDDIKIQRTDGHTNQIKLDDNIMMELKYPSLDQFIKNNFDFTEGNQMDQSFELIGSCIDKIYTEEEVWTASDCTKKELKEFLESMNSSQFKEIESFFETMPKLSHTIRVKNPNTEKESDVVLEGLASFFA